MKLDRGLDFTGLSGVLDGVLRELTAALESKDSGERDRLLEELRAFIKQSPDAIAGPLDDVAYRAILATAAHGWNDAAADLRTRTADLARLTSQIDAIAAEARAKADSIRDLKIRAAVDHATAAVEVWKDLRVSLKQQGDQDGALGMLEAAIQAVDTLSSRLGARPPG